MKNILFLQCSPHGETSLGTQVAREVIERLRDAYPGASVVVRDLAVEPLAPIAGDYAMAITGSRAFDDPAFSCSETLIAELERCDFLLVGTPMHNFTVPAALKLWIDYVLRIGRTFAGTPEGKVGLLKDRPALVLVRSGGVCTGPSARQPDFLTPYLRHALATTGIADTDFHYLEGVAPDAGQLAAFRRSVAASRALRSFHGESV
ncbi:FMN-dependent NADH-azoreductase [Paraburkholderia caballeronis]|uniref:FMN-dependent NADH-azoreductase n=1 Tax=Paraburkholderia caballeronis TaxID=416943 RepID=UPI00106613CC|nr:NAD(P)H-dependent oxidoreductase [Paraburkholderia caballeronis]TDV33940.1 FMN-dependent NADH-azoreductase [Paraburkholderia caballeronis]